MKKGQIVSLVIGSAALVAGAAAYTAAKLAGKAIPSRHDAKDKVLNTPYVPEKAPEVPSEKPEEQVEAAEEPEVTEVAEEQEAAKEPEALADEQDEQEEAAPEEEMPEQQEVDAAAEEPEQTGEHDPQNLEEYIELNPEERASLDVVKDSFAAEGVRTDISFMENTMFFDFVMTDVNDEETKEILAPDLDQFLNDQAESYGGIVKQLEGDTGFKDIKMIVIFMDADEDEIVSGHYDETGRTM